MTDLYLPPDTRTSSIPAARIAILGPPGSGKTTSLLTFPNLIIFDVDKKAPVGIPTIPAWDPTWADSVLYNPSTKNNGRIIPTAANFRDAIKKWLRENHSRFTSEQTLAIDSWSFLQDASDNQTYLEDVVCGFAKAEKSGKHNDYWFWEQKLNFTREIISYIRAMRCRVIVTFHEAQDRDQEGKLNGKIRPLMDGKYKDYILGAFTNVWRMQANVPVTNSSGLVVRDDQGVPKSSGSWFWQIKGDSVIDLNNDHSIDTIAQAEKIKRIQIIKDPDTGVVSGGYQTIQALYAKHLKL